MKIIKKIQNYVFNIFKNFFIDKKLIGGLPCDGETRENLVLQDWGAVERIVFFLGFHGWKRLKLKGS